MKSELNNSSAEDSLIGYELEVVLVFQKYQIYKMKLTIWRPHPISFLVVRWELHLHKWGSDQ